MKSRNDRKLKLEQLEDRTCPAILLVSLDGAGNLLVTGTPSSDTATFNFTGQDQIEVLDGANSLGTYSVPGNVRVNLGNKILNNPLTGLLVNFDMNGFGLSGNVNMTLGNVLNVGGGQSGYVVDDGDLGGTIQGNWSVTTGAGDDIFLMDNGTTVQGNANFSSGAGFDTWAIGDQSGVGAASSVGGFVTGTKVNDFGLAYLPTPSTVGGSVILNAASENVVNLYLFRGDIVQRSVVAGDVIVSTGNGPFDFVFLEGTINGNMIATLGNGPNNLLMQPSALVLGSLAYTGGTGGDVINLASTAGGGAVVLGNVTVVAGNGINQCLFDTNVFIGGSSITYIGGNQVDGLTYNAIAPGAHLRASLGAGADQFNLGSNSLAEAFIDFGAGVDTLVQTIPVVSFKLTYLNLP